MRPITVSPHLLVMALFAAILLALALLASVELFEDGSFILRGCLPWAICAEG